MRNLRRIPGIVLAIALLVGLGVSLVRAAPSSQSGSGKGQATIWGKIEPQVLKELDERGTTTFIVRLGVKADLASSRKAQDQGAESKARLTPERARALQLAQRQSVVATLQSTAEGSQRGVRAYLDRQQATGHVTAYKSFWIFNGLAVTGDRETVLALAARPDVESIRANHVRHIVATSTQVHRYPSTQVPKYTGSAFTWVPVYLGTCVPVYLSTCVPVYLSTSLSPASVSWNIAKIGADRVWSELGITGVGAVVGSVDTGVDWTHPALRNQYRGVTEGGVDHNYNWFDATGTFPQAPTDDLGHGTHTTGTAVGGDGGANQIGVAPGAKWIAVKVLDSQGVGKDVDIHTGLQWMIAPTDLSGLNPDPGKAPDVINNSWGSIVSADPSFWDDVNALRAAGIVPVFAAGNSGEAGAGSIEVPGSYPQSFSVGATDPQDIIASFSSQGPSFWDRIKPDVSAPGISVRSSGLDGQYELLNGTSMATPHVSGLVALLKSADPSLGVDDLEQFIRYTAFDLGDPGPDNMYGAGRIDAYKAVRWAISAGELAGQVRDATTGLPVLGATVEGVYQGRPDDVFRTKTDSGGHYSVSVPGGSYDLVARAFGYEPATVTSVEVITGFRSLRDMRLKPTLTGSLQGQVTSGFRNVPLAASIVVEGAAAPYSTDAAGRFSLTLPVGTHRLRISATGHRTLTTSVSIPAGAIVSQDFQLQSAPSILVVDADAWVGAVHLNYYRWPLDTLNLPYDTRLITDTAFVPTAAELSAYDLVIWGHFISSPGYIDNRMRQDTATTDALAGYVRNGGRLLIAGQDIGYWDSAEGSRRLAPDFYRNILHAHYLEDNASDNLRINGLAGDLFDGIHLVLEDVYGRKYGDDLAPDAIRPANSRATPVLQYGTTSDSAGLRVAEGQGRLIYLAFGVEGAGPRPELARMYEKAIAWLALPSLTLAADPPAVKPSGTLTFTLNIANTGSTPAPGLSLANPIPAELSLVPDSLTAGATYDAATHTIRWAGDMPARTEQTIRYRTSLAVPLAGGTLITNTATLTDSRGQMLSAHSTIQVVAPNLSGSAKKVTPAEASPGDILTYTITLLNSAESSSAGVSLVDPIPAGTHYVPGSVSGGATYNEAANQIEWTGTVPGLVSGAAYNVTLSTQPGGPVFNWVPITDTGSLIQDLGDDVNAGPFPIGFQFSFYNQIFDTFRVCSNGWLSFTSSGRNFADRALPDPDAPGNMVAVFWTDLDPGQGGSVYYRTNGADTLVVSFIEVARHNSNDRFTFQVVLRADGTLTFQYLAMNGDVANSTIGIQNADGTEGLTIAHRDAFAHDGLAVRIAPANVPQWPSITFQAQVDPALPANTAIQNIARIVDGQGIVYTRTATTVVLPADLTASEKQATPTHVTPGDALTYTITLRNSSQAGAPRVQVVDPLPAGVHYVEGSATGGAAFDVTRNRITWSGPVAPNMETSFNFVVRVDPELAAGTPITNTASLDDGIHPAFPLQATVQVVQADLTRSTKRVDRAAAASGQTLTYTVDMLNTGPAPVYTATLFDPIPTGLRYVDGSVTGGATFDPAANAVRWRGSLPAGGQYVWADSDRPGGPVFEWIDITTTGTPIAGLGDDSNAGPFPIGFDFPFYDQTFNTFRVCSNGWLSFSSAATSFDNLLLPDPGAPGNLLAVFWDDLTLVNTGSVYYWTNRTDTLIVSWIGIPRYGTDFRYTFQAILKADGSITYQYLTMPGTRLDEATIGIQNADGSQGLTVVHNRPFVHDGLAIRIAPPAPARISFRAAIEPGVPDDTVITNTATIDDGRGHSFTRTAATRVNVVDLSASRFSVSHPRVEPGARLDYSLTLINKGTIPSKAQASVPVPAHTRYVADSASGGAIYDASANSIRWQGEIPAGSIHQVGFAVQIDRPLQDGTALDTLATIQDGIHPAFTRFVHTIVVAPDLRSSTKTVNTSLADPDEVITYTLNIRNSGHLDTTAVVTDHLPDGVDYVAGSAWAGSGGPIEYDAASREIRWRGLLPARSLAQVRFAVRVIQAGVIVNVARIDDGYGSVVEAVATTQSRMQTVVIRAGRNVSGYVRSNNPLGNYLGDPNLFTGDDTRLDRADIFHGITQFDLSPVPPNARILSAELDLRGRIGRYLTQDPGGEWRVQILSGTVDQDWTRLGYWQIHNAEVSAGFTPVLRDADLAEGQVNTFQLDAAGLQALQNRLMTTGRVSLRLDGTTARPRARHIFAWDATAPPVLRISYLP